MSPAGKNMSTEAENIVEAVTRQRLAETQQQTEKTSCYSYICKCSMNPIVNPKLSVVTPPRDNIKVSSRDVKKKL
jgi:predicted SprT family Zn-dependent metalloprotease